MILLLQSKTISGLSDSDVLRSTAFGQDATSCNSLIDKPIRFQRQFYLLQLTYVRLLQGKLYFFNEICLSYDIDIPKGHFSEGQLLRITDVFRSRVLIK